MDAWGWEHLRPWLAARLELPVGPLFCVIDGPTRGRPWSSANARVEFRRLAAQAAIRRRFAPHQLRHAHAVELAREGVPLNVDPTAARPRQPGHHFDLPAGHRRRGDHRHRPRPARADDVRHRRTATLNNPKRCQREHRDRSRWPFGPTPADWLRDRDAGRRRRRPVSAPTDNHGILHHDLLGPTLQVGLLGAQTVRTTRGSLLRACSTSSKASLTSSSGRVSRSTRVRPSV
jgi:hypothetical protein